MTREQFIDRWATHLSGKFARFAFCDVSGPGLESRTRAMVQEIERATGQMYDQLANDPPKALNGKVEAKR